MLPKADQDVLDKLGYKQKLDEVDKAILVNADFLAEISENPEIFGHEVDTADAHEHGGVNFYIPLVNGFLIVFNSSTTGSSCWLVVNLTGITLPFP